MKYFFRDDDPEVWVAALEGAGFTRLISFNPHYECFYVVFTKDGRCWARRSRPEGSEFICINERKGALWAILSSKRGL